MIRLNKKEEQKIEIMQKQISLNTNRCFSLIDRIDQIYMELDAIKGQLTIITSILKDIDKDMFVSADKLLKSPESKKWGV